MFSSRIWLEAIRVDVAALVNGTQAVVLYFRKSEKEVCSLPIAWNMDAMSRAKTAPLGHEVSSEMEASVAEQDDKRSLLL